MSDVTIKYNNNTIGELNDSGTAVLQTANKKCISNIEVEYTKPEAPAGITAPPAFTLSRSGSNYSRWTFTFDNSIIDVNNNVMTSVSASNLNGNHYYIPVYDSTETVYRFKCTIYKSHAMPDLTVTINNTTIAYDAMSESYVCDIALPSYDTPIVMTVTDYVS